MEVTILPFDPSRAADFDRINREWVASMFVVEPLDDAVLRDPERHIVGPGGDVLFAATEAHGIVGTAALKRHAAGVFELTKMGVAPAARGLKIGETLLAATLRRAIEMEARELFLLTNSACAAAIHLYEKAGFVHDKGIMQTFGATYDRCNVAMRYMHLETPPLDQLDCPTS